MIVATVEVCLKIQYSAYSPDRHRAALHHCSEITEVSNL